jgi:hypothetical protein
MLLKTAYRFPRNAYPHDVCLIRLIELRVIRPSQLLLLGVYFLDDHFLHIEGDWT